MRKQSPRSLIFLACLSAAGLLLGIMLFARQALIEKSRAETPPPPEFSEVRSILAPSISTIDWLYTLRTAADYDEIAASQIRLSEKMNQLLEALVETEETPEATNNLFCDANAELAHLRTQLAPNSDATQPAVDESNEQVLDDIETVLGQVAGTWAGAASRPVTCS